MIDAYKHAGVMFDVEAEIWAMFAYLIRAYCLPEVEYQVLNKQYLQELAKKVLQKIESNFGRTVLFYNMHQGREFTKQLK